MLGKIKELKKLLSKEKKIIITTHTNPDGDAVGSSLALYHFLKKMSFLFSKGKCGIFFVEYGVFRCNF